MRRGWIFRAIGGGVVVVAAVAIAGCGGGSGGSSNAASSPATPGSAGGSSQAHTSAPVVTPAASGTYLSDLKPSGNLSEQVNSGPVKISGSIYPKSLSFYCSVGDPTPFPKYALQHDARRFQVTLGLPANSPSGFGAAVMLLGDGRTLRTVTVKAGTPKTVSVNVTGVHTLQLECYGSGNSATGGEAIALQWGNARVAGGG
jgi:NPCBM/NEW2 domain-containing protein